MIPKHPHSPLFPLAAETGRPTCTASPSCCSVACRRPPFPVPGPPCPCRPLLYVAGTAPKPFQAAAPYPRLLRLMLFHLLLPVTLTAFWCVEARPFLGRDQFWSTLSTHKGVRICPGAFLIFSLQTEGDAWRKQRPRRFATCFSPVCPILSALAR